MVASEQLREGAPMRRWNGNAVDFIRRDIPLRLRRLCRRVTSEDVERDLMVREGELRGMNCVLAVQRGIHARKNPHAAPAIG